MAKKKKINGTPVDMSEAAEPVAEAVPAVEPDPLEADEIIHESREHLVNVDGVTYHHNRKLADGRRVYLRLRSA